MGDRYFYAVEYAYGKFTINRANIPNTVRRFKSARERDEWVLERRTDYMTDSGYREAIPSTHPYVRRKYPSWYHDTRHVFDY